MSRRTMALGESNRNSASVLHSSVLPTPVGPARRKLPSGRSCEWRPARASRIVLATARMASSWPTTLWRSSDSIDSNFSRSPRARELSGMPVDLAMTPRMSASETWSARSPGEPSRDPSAAAAAAPPLPSSASSCGMTMYLSSDARVQSARLCAASSSRLAPSSFSVAALMTATRALSASHCLPNASRSSRFRFVSASTSRSRATLAASFSFRSASSSMRSVVIARSRSSMSSGLLSCCILRRAAASSTRSMAESGRRRSVMYLCALTAAATSAGSVMRTPWCAS
mmetsp:Transcript_5440/g.13105  ORF Transcript_5440/g.13105 Transcript_5440/m.13105 type:complete len:285 (+) Transcript_5440:1105-1959(+)